ncbi:MAG: PEP-CTERM sorting domain-containing protein [Alphaproteobacteria bacterium]|nr:PEP-CTERM sorting domain-containing protein [Alphaproteobacteria bacterium]
MTVGDAFELSFVGSEPMYNMAYQEYIILDMTNVLSLIGTASNLDLTIMVGELGSGWPNIFGSIVTASNSLIPSDLNDLAIQAIPSNVVHIDLNAIGLNAANPYLILTKVTFDSVPSGPSPEMYLKYLSLSFDNCVLEDNCSGGGDDDDVPEPGLIGLFGFSLAGLAALRWRR